MYIGVRERSIRAPTVSEPGIRAATVRERFGIAQRGNRLLTRAALIQKRSSTLLRESLRRWCENPFSHL